MATLFFHLIVVVVRLARPGGFRSVVAESVLVRHQLLILNRGRKRAPNLRAADRIIAGLCTLLMRPVLRAGAVGRQTCNSWDMRALSRSRTLPWYLSGAHEPPWHLFRDGLRTWLKACGARRKFLPVRWV